ncbi:MAG TPA: TOMM precursor leader peptide-binding protein [Pirellulales bacterium]|nr:TOMM precursor leader peptide-binding protein [Pirellulales bacterium]
MLVKPVGAQLWIGPLFRPGTTGCWQCLAERLRANRAVESYLVERGALAEGAVADRATTPASLHAARGLTANVVASWAVRGELPDYEGNIRTFDLLSWQTQTHLLTRLPYCAACSRPTNGAARQFQPVSLESGKKSFVRDGGHRVASPEATLDRFSRHVSPITGAVSMLERSSPQGDGAMHVYLAGHNLARRRHNLGQLRTDLRNMSAGKGASDVQAKASGLCEGLERYSGVFRGDEPRRTARMAELGDAAIALNRCLLFSERQYRERDAWNDRKSPYNFVPLPFDPDAELEWSPVWSLSREEVRYLPTAFCYYDYPLPKDQRYCIACSNGCAAGNTLEEAILQGFLELVERDSVALWWYNRVRRRGVDLDSFDEPYLARLSDYLSACRRELFVLDLTSDLNIPVFAAWSRRTDAAQEQIVLGFGAHLDARIALLRAVTEMNQMLSYLLQIPADQVYNEHLTDQETARWLKTATGENQPYLMPDERAAPCASTEYRQTWAEDVRDDVRACQALVARQGLEMLVLDQTRPEIGLPVAKVIVPGLRHFWARFAPGRLYDAPLRLGWLPKRLAEDELNPIPMFL